MLFKTTYDSPVGTLTIVSTETHVRQVLFAGEEAVLAPGETWGTGKPQVLQQAEKWLADYFAGRMPSIMALPLEPLGSAFRRLIWYLLCQIPYGEVRTYGELAAEAAARLGKTTMAAQAVGGAVGQNPLPIIIPCHRVIGAQGKLTGYRGGIEKKVYLLHHEGFDKNRFSWKT